MRGCLPSSRYKKTAKCLSYLSGPFYLPVSFPLLLSQSLPFYTSFLTWGCIGLRFLFFWLIFPSILGESLWINHNPFLLVKDLIKHPAHLNLILTSLCTAFLICFPLIFQLQNRMYCKENHLFFFSISRFLAITNHRAYSTGNCVSLDLGPLHPSSYI